MSFESDVTAVISAIKSSNKYGDTSKETIRELAIVAMRQHKKPKAAIKAVRKRLHSIMAPYLGDPDYALVSQQLTDAFAQNNSDQINQICHDALYAHLSTRERLPIM
ncbi:MAG: hypothetical protein GY943_03755, partial [Chloroflexi bacterium]|nr:hypothetical protein [Chloroflexota bacterium]